MPLTTYRKESPHFYRADGEKKNGKSWSGAQFKDNGSGAAYMAGREAADKVNLGTNDNALGAAERRGIGS